VAIVLEHLPPGIRPEDNDAGTRSSLEKLARYIEREAGMPARHSCRYPALVVVRVYQLAKSSLEFCE